MKAAKRKLVIGIQGGKGSFNEEAVRSYCAEKGITNYRVKYLYTTKRVLKALHEKKIDRGLFAIENTLGGAVMETINALSRYNCRILDSHKISVMHCLLTRPGVPLGKIKTIISHPQALAQCHKTLAKMYPRLAQETGKGIQVDQATAAKYLSKGEYPDSVAVIASRIAGELFGLHIVRCGIQDSKKNFTTFLFVSRFNGKN